jgi:hypothetical protein
MQKLINDITDSHCSFDVSFLLKEKGAVLDSHYSNRSKSALYYFIHAKTDKEKEELYTYQYFRSFDSMLSAPTHSIAIEWLRINFGIWIEITYGKDSNEVWFDYNIYSLIKPRKDDELGEDGVEYEEDPNERWLNYDTTYDSMIDDRFEMMDKKNYDSPGKAKDAALLYALSTL